MSALDHRQALLLLSDGEIHSGESLGVSLGISRAAIWKRLQALEALGVHVESVKGRGYRIPGGLSLLNPEAIIAGISVADRAWLDAIHVFDEIDSTNQFLLDQPVGLREVCLAERQSAGRGRRGRVWFSPYGKNLYLSISWNFHQGAAALQGLSLAVGVAVAQGLQALGTLPVSLKWPNDILINGRKLGGVLIELSGDASGECKAVIGLGLNVSMSDLPFAGFQSSIDQPWEDLKRQGLICDRNTLSAVIIERLVGLLSVYPERGFSYYRSEWDRLNAHAGQVVQLITPVAKVEGVMRGVDVGGALLLETPDGVQAFTGGEISLRGGHDY